MASSILRIEPGSHRREDLAPVTRALAEGAVVAYPTETLYAVLARRDDESATARLRSLLDEPDRPLTVHAPSVAAALALPEAVPPRALPLIRRFWPGPVTIVFPGKERGLGVRVPAHPIAQELLELAGATLVAATPAASPPLASGAAVLEKLGAKLDWVVDAGETPLREPSTVVRVFDEGWECLRDGIVSRDMLARHLDTTVLFVCTGNSCRSPMAEALFRRKLAGLLGIDEERLERAGFHVRSAGTAAQDGGPASPLAVRIMEDRALDISHHVSHTITQEDMERASVVFAMSPSHAYSLGDWWPEQREKVQVLDENGIVDPIGGSPELYRECADAIEARLDRVVERLFSPETVRWLEARRRKGA